MSTGKTSALTFRVNPGLKEALRAAHEHEHRSSAKIMEGLIPDHCSRGDIRIARGIDQTGDRVSGGRSLKINKQRPQV